jgi:hypothetical protein
VSGKAIKKQNPFVGNAWVRGDAAEPQNAAQTEYSGEGNGENPIAPT